MTDKCQSCETLTQLVIALNGQINDLSVENQQQRIEIQNLEQQLKSMRETAVALARK